MSKKEHALDMILGEIKFLKKRIIERDYIGSYYCNNWSNGGCTIHDYECKIGDKNCLEYDYSELLTQIDSLANVLKDSFKPTVYKDNEINEKEMINHPQHYNMGKFEAIDVIEDWQLNFNLGNTVKYISRAGHKDDIIQDLKKSLWYLDREIKRLEKGV